jgi:uridine phosphorylase
MWQGVTGMAEGYEEVVIEPRRGKREERVPPGIIMCFTPPDMKTVVHCLGLAGSSRRRLDFWTLRRCEPPLEMVGVVGPAFGAPAAVTLLERLVALEAKAVIGLGSCGSLQAKVPIGTIVLPEASVVEEGTSPHYLAPGVNTAPHAGLLREMCRALEEEGMEPVLGKVWTTDAVFRETKAKVMELQRQGVLAVDMESSALMTVASFRGVPLVCVLVVSDELWTLKWKKGFRSEKFLKALSAASRASARCLKSWCHKRW